MYRKRSKAEWLRVRYNINHSRMETRGIAAVLDTTEWKRE